MPETVTAEQVMSRWEEVSITVDEHQNAERINDRNLAGMLVLNCSYMEPSEFNALVNEHFGSVDELRICYEEYNEYLTAGYEVYGSGISVAPEKLLFDEYLINQSEQLTYLIGMYQVDTEKSKEYYDILMNYLIYGENELFTFDCDDARLEGSGLACLKRAALSSLFDDIVEYDTNLYTGNNVFSAASTNLWDIVYEHSN